MAKVIDIVSDDKGIMSASGIIWACCIYHFTVYDLFQFVVFFSCSCRCGKTPLLLESKLKTTDERLVQVLVRTKLVVQQQYQGGREESNVWRDSLLLNYPATYLSALV